MKAEKGLMVATWIASVGAFLFWTCLSCLLIMALVPPPGSEWEAPLLLASSLGFGMTAFASFWLIYWAVKLWVKRAKKPDKGEQIDGK